MLVAYFSRPGENWWNGGRRDLEVGNTEWNVRAPMIMTTFAERYDFSGTTVHPVTTHAMSGLGTTEDDYARSCRGARTGAGLAVRGERAGSAGAQVDAWLREAGLRG